jgi:hypothetical protein
LATLLTQQRQVAQARARFEQARQIAFAVRQANVDLEEEAVRSLLGRPTQHLQAYASLLASIAREPALDPSLHSAALDAFLVAGQGRDGSVQAALARAAVRVAASTPAMAALVRHVQDPQQRQRALWQQQSNADHPLAAAGNTSRLAALQQTAPQVARELAEAAARLHETFPRYAELAAPAPIDVPMVQALLHHGEALVSWCTLPDRVLVWLVRPDQVPVYRDLPIAKAALMAMVARVRESLAQGPWEPFAVAEAHALYALLLEPLRAQLTGVTHLLLVPDAVLRPLPFGVLVTEATGEPYQRLATMTRQPRPLTAADLAAYAQLAWLAKTYALTFLPSATTLRALRPRLRAREAPREPLLAFGDPVLQGEGGQRGGAPMPRTRGRQVPLEWLRQLPRLPETRAELLAVATALGADARQSVFRNSLLQAP